MRAPITAGLMALTTCGALGQSAPPSFEVASIRQHKTAVEMVASSTSGPRVTMIAYPLLGLIMDAYQLESYQITGGPSWMESDRYDIVARAPGGNALTDAQVRLMLQSLLAERFQLKVHRETRVEPVYLLEPAKNGPKLKGSSAEHSGMSLHSSSSLTFITMAKADMPRFAKQLSSSGAGRPVLDMTGLAGEFDFTLRFAVEDASAALDSNTAAPPSLFTAIQEQLGLKLVPAKRPVEILVIDGAERPSDN